MKAAILCGSMNVWYSSSAVVRNSSLSVSFEVLTMVLEPALVFGVAAAAVASRLGSIYLGVETPLEGPDPGACWISLPCSAFRVDGSLSNSWRSSGTSLERTSALTGSFSFELATLSMLNYEGISPRPIATVKEQSTHNILVLLHISGDLWHSDRTSNISGIRGRTCNRLENDHHQ